MTDLWQQTVRLFSFADANVRYVFSGMLLLGMAGGVLGCFTLLRKRALIGDALAHAALPGIAVAYILTGTKSIGVLLIGAYLAGAAGIGALLFIRRFSRIKDDSALAIVLTVFFGVGIVLLTYIQKSGRASQTGLDKFLFGQSASLVGSEVMLVGITAAILLAASLLFYKEFKLLCFDSQYADTIGFPALWMDVLLMGLTVGAVVIGLQAVGVVLMAALLIIPPATARLWSNRLGTMILLSGICGALAGALGSYVSFLAPRMPSGPLTVVAGASFFAVSLLAAPQRGLLSRLIHRRRLVHRTQRENFLRTIAEMAEVRNCQIGERFTLEQLAHMRNEGSTFVRRHVARLIQAGYAQWSGSDAFQLTVVGCQESQYLLRRHRLWELYLMHRADIASDHVHRDADESEHFLTPAMERRLIEIAGEEAEALLSPHPVKGGDS